MTAPPNIAVWWGMVRKEHQTLFVQTYHPQSECRIVEVTRLRQLDRNLEQIVSMQLGWIYPDQKADGVRLRMDVLDYLVSKGSSDEEA